METSSEKTLHKLIVSGLTIVIIAMEEMQKRVDAGEWKHALTKEHLNHLALIKTLHEYYSIR